MIRMRCANASRSACVRCGFSHGNTCFMVSSPAKALLNADQRGRTRIDADQTNQRECESQKRQANVGIYLYTSSSAENPRSSLPSAQSASIVLSFIPCQQRQHFEMRRAPFARQAFAAEHLEAGPGRQFAQFAFAETQVAMVERFDRRTVRVAGERGGQKAAAGTQHVRRFGNDLGR